MHGLIFLLQQDNLPLDLLVVKHVNACSHESPLTANLYAQLLHDFPGKERGIPVRRIK